jgi:hypothetical protein
MNKIGFALHVDVDAAYETETGEASSAFADEVTATLQAAIQCAIEEVDLGTVGPNETAVELVAVDFTVAPAKFVPAKDPPEINTC